MEKLFLDSVIMSRQIRQIPIDVFPHIDCLSGILYD